MISTEQDLARHVGREDSKAWPSHAWPGGYPIAYLMRDGGILCAACMTVEAVTFGHDPYGDDQWNVTGAWAYGASTDYPETDERCDHCNVVICTGDDDTTTTTESK